MPMAFLLFAPRRLARLSVVACATWWAAHAQAADWPAFDAAVAKGQWPLAQTLVEQGLAEHPRDARLRLLLGVAQARTQQLAAAHDTLAQLADAHPELSEAHNNLGIVLALQGRWTLAVRAFERAELANPQNAAALENLARARAQQALQAPKPASE